MNRIIRMAVPLIIVLSAAAEITREEALKDWGDLAALHAQTKGKIGEIVPVYNAVIVGTEYDQIINALDDFQKNDQPTIQKALDAFGGKYGTSASDIDTKMNTLTASRPGEPMYSVEKPSPDAGRCYEDLGRWLKNVPEARRAKAADLLRDADILKQSLSSATFQLNTELFDKLKNAVDTARRLDPEGKEAAAAADEFEKFRKETIGAFEKAIDEKKFPAPFSPFAGPGDPDTLVAAATECLKKQWDKENVLAVALRGDWWSAEKNIVGETIQWGLPIWAAVCTDAERKENIARVFALTVVTKTERGIEKKPPFTAVLVGDTYKMRISNIKEMGGKRTTGGFFGTIFWLALIGANVLAGLLAAAPLLKVKAPQLAAFYANIAPLRAVVGVIVLAVGVGSFLRNLVFFLAPFADLLPQLAVVAAGLFLGKELIMQIAGGTKAADALAKQQAKIDAIERYQVPIGLACLVLAVIHLFFGGVVLF